jgi:hypothetical protein
VLRVVDLQPPCQNLQMATRSLGEKLAKIEAGDVFDYRGGRSVRH